MESRRPGAKRTGEFGGPHLARLKRRCGDEELSAAQDTTAERSVAAEQSSSFRGVIWHQSNSKWEARIKENSKQRFLGYYESENEAARVHDAAALQLHGAKAELNFPFNGQASERQRQVTLSSTPPLLSPLLKGTSQFRGVSWNQGSGKWRAQLCHGEAVHHLGYFESEVEAAHEYDRNAIRIKGESAATNFPAEDYLELQSKGEPALGHKESRYLGVSWDGKSCHWVAELWDGHQYVMLGKFQREVVAARAYDTACLRMYGSVANVNFPVPVTRARKQDLDVSNNEAELELAAMEALASMSSTMDDGTHFDTSPPITCEDQQAGSNHRSLPYVRRGITPETIATVLQPTPSPYQESNCDNIPSSDDLADQVGAMRVTRANNSAEGPAHGGVGKKSLFKGVSWHKHCHKWYAYIQHAGKMRGLGYFQDQRDAAAAYDAEAVKVLGQKAVLNFPSSSRGMSAPPAKGPRHLTRASVAQALLAKNPQPRDASIAQSQGIKWNPADEKYHVFLWDKEENCIKSRGSFESKDAAVRAMHGDSSLLAAQTNLQSDSDAAGYTAQMSRCNSFADRSTTVSPFSEAPAHASDAADTFGHPLATLEPASSIKSPLKLVPSQAAPEDLSCAEANKGANLTTATRQHQEGRADRADTAKGKRVNHGLPRPRTRSAAPMASSESDDSSAGVVGNSWGQGSSVVAVSTSDGEAGKTRVKTLRSSDILPASETDFPQLAAPAAPKQAAKKRARQAGSQGTERSRSRLQYRGSSKYKGVSWSERSGKWRAQMWFGNKVHHLGFFDSEEGAARCYDAAVVELRGPSAPTNFEPEETGSKTNCLKPSVLQNLTSASLPKVTSHYRGVRWHYCNSKWEARIFNGARQVSLGYFENEIDAAIAYDEKARGLRGATAVVNFPEKNAAETPAPKPAARRPPLTKQTQEDDDYLPVPPTRWGSKRRRF